MLEEILEKHGEQVKYIIITKSTERRELDQLRVAKAFVETKIAKLEEKLGLEVKPLATAPNPALLERVAKKRKADGR